MLGCPGDEVGLALLALLGVVVAPLVVAPTLGELRGLGEVGGRVT